MHQPPNPYPQQQSPMPPQQPQYPYYQRPEPPYAPPPEQPPAPLPKKPGKDTIGSHVSGVVIALAMIVGLGVLVLVIADISSAGGISTQDTAARQTAQKVNQAATALAKDVATTEAMRTAVQKWTTTHTFNGNTIQKTAVFTVSDDFKLIWKCDPSSNSFGAYNVIVDLDAPDGSYIYSAVNTICQAGNTSGSTEMHGDAGQVFLVVDTEGPWTIHIQELK